MSHPRDKTDVKTSATAAELAAALNALRSGSGGAASMGAADAAFDSDDDGPVEATQVLDMRQQEELMSLRAEQSKKLSRLDKAIVVMFTDLVGSTQYYERHGDLKGREKVLTHNAILFPIVQQHAGVIVKTIGDAIMAYYATAPDALKAASRMQHALSAYNSGISDPDEQIHIRIALNAGVAIAAQGDIYGDVVNVAARIEHQAGADEVLMSASVSEALKASPEKRVWPLEDAGSATFKGKAEPIALLRLRWRELAPNDAKQAAFPDRFAVKQLLAKGSSGELFLAEERKQHRTVALKRLYDHLSNDTEARAAFIAAAKQQAALQLPGVVRVFSTSEAGDQATFYEAEVVQGSALTKLMSAFGPPQPAEAAAIVSQVAALLAKAHESGALHKNLEPDNLLVRHDGSIAITNFGQADLASLQLRKGNSPPGSTAFMAPEHLLGNRASVKSDVYSLGALLYYLLSGREPIEDASSLEGTLVAASGAIVPLKKVAPNVAPEFVRIVNRSMSLAVGARYADAGAIIADLKPLCAGAAEPAAYLLKRPEKADKSAAKPTAARASQTTSGGGTNPRIQLAGQTQPLSAPQAVLRDEHGAGQPGTHTSAGHALSTVAPSSTPTAPSSHSSAVTGPQWLSTRVLGLALAITFTLGLLLGVVLGQRGKKAPEAPTNVLAIDVPPPVAPAPPPASPMVEKLTAAGVLEHGDATAVVDGVASVAWPKEQRPVDLGRLSPALTVFAALRLVDLGLIAGLDEPLGKWIPELAQGRKKLITLRHLLEHTSGIREAGPDEPKLPMNVAQFALAADVVDAPGSKLAQSQKAFNLIALFVERVSGKPLDGFFGEQVAKPLGLSTPRFSRDPSGAPVAAAPVTWTTGDFAKLLATANDGGRLSDGPRYLSEASQALLSAPLALDASASLLGKLVKADVAAAAGQLAITLSEPNGSFAVVAPYKRLVVVRSSTAPVAAELASLNAVLVAAEIKKGKGPASAPASAPAKP